MPDPFYVFGYAAIAAVLLLGIAVAIGILRALRKPDGR